MFPADHDRTPDQSGSITNADPGAAATKSANHAPLGSRRSQDRTSILSPLKAIALVGLGAGAVLAVPQFFKPQNAEARQIVVAPPKGAPASFADLIENVSPAVVAVHVKGQTPKRAAGRNNDDTPEDVPPEVEEFLRRFGVPPGGLPRGNEDQNARPSRVAGSGFFISEKGFIVTNNHVVADAAEIAVTLSDGREIPAELVGADERTDLAVLKAKTGDDFPFVTFASTSKPRVGDWVVAIGNPFDLGATATAGIVSAVSRSTGDQYVDFLQIDAPINRGNSGGPTFNLYGQVIGVNSQILSPTGGSVGIGFAVPADVAEKIVGQLMAKGKVTRGWLGVSIGAVSENVAAATGLKDAKGALVSTVTDDSPAAKGGLKSGDIILGVDGSPVKDNTDLSRRVADLAANSTHEFDVFRQGQRKKIKITIGERPSEQVLAGNNDATPGDSGGRSGPAAAVTTMWGLKVSPITTADRRRLNMGANENGLVIVDIDNDSPLIDEGLRPGLAILEANYQSVSSPTDLDKAVQSAKKEGLKAVLLRIQTPNGPVFVGAPLSAG